MRKSVREDQYYYCMVHFVRDYGTVATIRLICTKLGTRKDFLKMAALACEGAMSHFFFLNATLCFMSCSNTRLSKMQRVSLLKMWYM